VAGTTAGPPIPPLAQPESEIELAKLKKQAEDLNRLMRQIQRRIADLEQK